LRDAPCLLLVILRTNCGQARLRAVFLTPNSRLQ
jgi:hypothetical protein